MNVLGPVYVLLMILWYIIQSGSGNYPHLWRLIIKKKMVEQNYILASIEYSLKLNSWVFKQQTLQVMPLIVSALLQLVSEVLWNVCFIMWPISRFIASFKACRSWVDFYKPNTWGSPIKKSLTKLNPASAWAMECHYSIIIPGDQAPRENCPQNIFWISSSVGLAPSWLNHISPTSICWSCG